MAKIDDHLMDTIQYKSMAVSCLENQDSHGSLRWIFPFHMGHLHQVTFMLFSM